VGGIEDGAVRLVSGKSYRVDVVSVR
jgi:hypothetical protein